MPTLVDGGRAIIESSVIIAYLDDIVSTPPLTPPDPFARAEMRLWIKWSDDHAYNAVYVPTWKKLSRPVARHLSDEELAERLAAVPTADLRERWRATAREGFSQAEFDAAFAEVTATLEPMESALRDGREWLVGDYSLADIAIVPFVERIDDLHPELLAIDCIPPFGGAAALLDELCAGIHPQREIKLLYPGAGGKPDQTTLSELVQGDLRLDTFASSRTPSNTPQH